MLSSEKDLLAKLYNCSGDFPVNITLVSSAKSSTFESLLRLLGRSLMKIKSNGPRIDPCGTPFLITPNLDE